MTIKNNVEQMSLLRFLMFNRLTRFYLNSDHWFLRLNKRVKSLILEMWYTLSIFFPLIAIPLFLSTLFNTPTPTNFTWIELITLIPFSMMIIILFNKDFFGGQSVIHRKLGYKVLDAKTKETASKIQCLVRNLTGPLWPIEAVFILVNPKRRLGDLIAGTILVDVPTSDPELILTEIKESKANRQTKLTLLISIICIALYLFLGIYSLS